MGERTLLRNLTAKKIASWSRARLAGEIRGQGKKPVPMSPQGVNSDLRSIKAALATAVDWGWLDRAPKIKLLRVPDSPPRHLIPEEIDALMKALPKGWTKAKRDQCNQLWTFCLFTACRRSEALASPGAGFPGQNAHGPHQGQGRQNRAHPLLPQAVEAMGEPKDSGPVFLFPRSDRPTRAEIRRMQKAYSNAQLARRLGVSDVCIGRWSRTKEPEPYAPHPDTISHWFKAQARAAGLRLPRLHDMRHTAVTYMLAKGVAPRLVQRIARHSSFSTTEQYAKGDMEMLYDEMISKVGNGQSRTKLSRGLFLVNDSNDIT